jgi:ribose transport system ATP-binding protein
VSDLSILEALGLTKRFAGTLALDGVDLEIRSGEVHALLGENGAGKSTLIKILAGVYRADAGEVRVRSRPVDLRTERLPLSFIHQDLGLVDSLTVAESVAVQAGYRRRHGLISWRATREAAAEALAALGGGIDPDARVGGLRAAERSLVGIARALAVEADVLVLDEPTAALPEADVARLLAALRGLRGRGLGILYVSHRLDEVFRIADRVTVLRDGRRVGCEAVSATTPGRLVELIVGRPLEELFRAPPPAAAATLLEVEGLVTAGAGPVSFSLHAGEILGLVGLRGAGHHAIGRALFGDLERRAGRIVLSGRELTIRSSAEAVALGIGFVSSKRGEESVAPNLAVRENLFMNPAAGPRSYRLLGGGGERGQSRRTLDRFGVRPPEPEIPIIDLSGGNQQKVVLARWIEAGARLLVLEEPTFGVDVGAKAEIYRLLRQALEQGRGVRLISSERDEVAGACHRALVFDRGRIATAVSGADLTVPRLTALTGGALGGSGGARAA